YSNEAKRVVLGVTPVTLAKHGAVSRETAQAMATGVLAHAPVDLAVSITGIAGPGGAVPGKPVGLVYLAAASRSGRLIQCERKYGDRGGGKGRGAGFLGAWRWGGDLAGSEGARPPFASGETAFVPHKFGGVGRPKLGAEGYPATHRA